MCILSVVAPMYGSSLPPKKKWRDGKWKMTYVSHHLDFLTHLTQLFLSIPSIPPFLSFSGGNEKMLRSVERSWHFMLHSSSFFMSVFIWVCLCICSCDCIQICIYVKVNHHVSPLPWMDDLRRNNESTLALCKTHEHHDLTHPLDLTILTLVFQ